MYQLKSGDLFVTVEPDKKCTMYYMSNLQEIYDEKEEKFTSEFEGFFALEHAPLEMNAVGIRSCSFVFPLSKEVKEYDGTVREREDSVIYLEGKGGKRVKVWEKGQKVEIAPPEIEGKAKRAIEKEYQRGREDLENEMATPEEVAGRVASIAEHEDEPRRKAD